MFLISQVKIFFLFLSVHIVKRKIKILDLLLIFPVFSFWDYELTATERGFFQHYFLLLLTLFLAGLNCYLCFLLLLVKLTTGLDVEDILKKYSGNWTCIHFFPSGKRLRSQSVSLPVRQGLKKGGKKTMKINESVFLVGTSYPLALVLYPKLKQ